MLFILSDKYCVISVANESNDCLQLSVFDLKNDNKNAVIIDLTEMSLKSNNNIDSEDVKTISKNEENNYSINCGVFSSNSNYLAICDNRKQLIVFSNNENKNIWKLVIKHKLNRNCFKILFSHNNESVICGDRSGDVYSYDVSTVVSTVVSTDVSTDSKSSGRLLLGHISMLLDMTLTIDSKYLITCDRDEKIRISHFPNTYNINSYCLGHKEFVSSIAIINNETLVSGSGDGSIRLWHLSSGQSIYVLNCDESECIPNSREDHSKFAVKKLVTNRGFDPQFLSVSFYNQSIVNIYVIESKSLKLIHSLKLDEEPIDIQFDASNGDVLWVLQPIINNPLNVYKITSEDIKKDNSYTKIIQQINSNSRFQSYCLNSKTSEELQTLYKHWFNNVDIYLQKKHERQHKKKKFNK